MVLTVISFAFLAAFGLDYYTEVLDLSYLLQHLSDETFFRKYKALNQALIGLVEDYSLVSFIPLSVKVVWYVYIIVMIYHYGLFYQDKESIFNVMKAVDKAGGYVFHGEGMNTLSSMMSTAMGTDFDFSK